jgi:hypothetical protein
MSDKLIEKIKSYLLGKPDYEKLDILFNENGFDVEFIKKVYPNLIKTFSDLKFKPHRNNWMGDKAVQATLDFDNGHWISVVGGADGLYGDGTNTFEIGFPVSGERHLDVIGYLSPESITEEIFKIQIKKPFKS